MPKKTIVISITLPCYFPFKTSNSAIVIHCIHFIKLLTNFNLFKLTLLTRFYRPFDSISFHKHPCKDASNNRIWVISLFTKNKKFISMYTELYKIKYLFDMTLLYKFAESLEVALFIPSQNFFVFLLYDMSNKYNVVIIITCIPFCQSQIRHVLSGLYMSPFYSSGRHIVFFARSQPV